MCLYSKLMINKKYIGTLSNGFNPPGLTDERVKYVPVKCGRCAECRKARGMEWKIRLAEEIKRNDGERWQFVTFTYSEKALNVLERKHKTKNANEIATKSVRYFLERWRKKYGKSVRHWFITEIGGRGTERLHLHGILKTDCTEEEIAERWQYGIVRVGGYDKLTGKYQNYVNERTINYIAKYITKVDTNRPDYIPKVLCSKGIGKGYELTTNASRNEFRGSETKDNYVLGNGQKVNLPIYYRNKLYTEEEREKLWISKLEKEERYIMGDRYPIKNLRDEEVFMRALKNAREKNIRMGYGTDERSQEEVLTRNAKIKKKRKELTEKAERVINVNKYKGMLI